VSWELEFQARPFKLTVSKTSQRKPYSSWGLPSLPERAYRAAARQTLRRLAEENRALRTRPHYRAKALPSALAEALLRWSRARWPDR
jgi:hypothetical protein